jgi:hypothetical protein
MVGVDYRARTLTSLPYVTAYYNGAYTNDFSFAISTTSDMLTPHPWLTISRLLSHC